MPDSAEERFGPIDYVVVEFPDGTPTPAGFELLLAEVDGGRIRLLDLELVAKRDGAVHRVDVSSFAVPALAPFDGASAQLLDADDLALLGERLADGTTAAIVVYEELSMFAVIDAWSAEGARLVADGQLTPADLAAALDATDA